MSNFDWKRCLEQHPVFSDLSTEEITSLLDEDVSIEMAVDQNLTIVKEGDQDQSIYLIGQGAADVVLKGDNGQNVFLNSLGKGDLIGEMAVFEQKPRSATVIATEPCILLEFRGKKFINLLQQRPDICFKLLIKLSERLRDLGDDVLNAKLKDVDDKIIHVNAKLDSEIKIIDASLKATQTVFDQTSKRAHEVIDSADRSRSRFTVAASTLGTIFTVLFSILGYTGFEKLEKVKGITDEAEAEFRTFKDEMEGYRQKMIGFTEETKAYKNYTQKNIQDIDKMLTNLDDSTQVFSKLDVSDRQINELFKKSLVTLFHTEMSLDTEKAQNTYDSILSFKDNDVSDALYRQIVVDIFNATPPIRNSYAEILKSGIDNRNTDLNGRQKTLSFYLLLTTYILNEDNNQYDQYLEKFKEALKSIHDPVKETAEASFGAAVFEELIKADAKSSREVQDAKIAKINQIWGLIR
jgi:CRP/FNR family cyclic AMP-dependent transcriptional regulator